ncbi:uncharacterized protein [Leptinotarsa decemlineata]|uniref:uncharacterized protein n=1 Tax=Leptinotarsa decemlineata TaxID=7539 RepID=UPI003D30BAB2
MNSFIENVNEGRGKKMLQILFVEESKADHEKMENRPQVETLQSNFVETSSVPVLEVAHPNSEGVYILTYNNENITADDVLKGEFLFDDTNIELQEVQLVTEVNNNNQEYEEQEEVKTYDQEVNIADDGNNVYEDDVSDKSDDYIPDENGYSSDREYEENENLENNVQQPILEFEKVQEEPQDQEIIEINRGTKKRLKNEKLWAKNVKKFKVNSGEAYQTKSGNLKQAKTVKEGCGDKCKLKCSENVDLEDRKKMLSDFLTLTDITRKRDFISKLMDEVKPKYCYKKDDSHRSANYSYNFIINRNKVKVCKKMFTDTLCISSTFLTTVKKKMSSTGVIEPDLRGKHLNQPKTDPQTIKDIIDHINSFARIESHYCRSDTKREYIDGDLNQAEMYRLYKKKLSR